MLVERMPRGENNGKQRPAQPYFVRQIDPIHDATQPNVCEDQCNVLSTDQHDGEGNFGAFGLPPEKWSSLMYGLWPDGGLKNGKEATHCGRDRHEAAAG